MTTSGPKPSASEPGPDKIAPSSPIGLLPLPAKTITPASQAASQPKATGTTGVKSYDAPVTRTLTPPEGWHHDILDGGDVTAWRFDRQDGTFILLADAETGTLELQDGRLVDFNNLRDPGGSVMLGQYAYRIPNQPWHQV